MNPFAKSDVGINYGDFLRFIGFKSPKEFGDLGSDEKRFWHSWYNEKMTRLKREVDK